MVAEQDHRALPDRYGSNVTISAKQKAILVMAGKEDLPPDLMRITNF